MRLDVEKGTVRGRWCGNDFRFRGAGASSLAAVGACVSRQRLQGYPIDPYRLPIALTVLKTRSRGRRLRGGRWAARHLVLLEWFRVQSNSLALPWKEFRSRSRKEYVPLRSNQVDIRHCDRVNQIAVYYQSNLHRVASEGDHVWKGTDYGYRHRIPIEIELGRRSVLFHQFLKVTCIVVTK